MLEDGGIALRVDRKIGRAVACVAGLVAATLTGCAEERPSAPAAPAATSAETGPPPVLAATSDGTAKLLVFRQTRFVAGGELAVVKINGKMVGRLGNGGVMMTEVPAGPVEMQVSTMLDFGRLTMPLKAEAGRQYYVELVAQLPHAVVGATGIPYFFKQDDPSPGGACGGRWCAVPEPASVALPRLNGR